MKNRLTLLVGFLALGSLTIAGGWISAGQTAPRQLAGGGMHGGGIAPSPKLVADGQETHGVKKPPHHRNA